MSFIFEENDFRWMGMGLRQTIYADGVIILGTAARLKDVLDAHRVIPGAMIDFNSPGGNLQEALRVGRLIRQRHLQTNVSRHGADHDPEHLNGICYSACTIAFLGGMVRYAPKGTAFGVHRFAIAQNTLSGAEALDASQIQSSQVAEYVNFMGIRPGFITEMNSAGPTEMNVLSQEKLAALRILTPLRETTWELRTTPTGDIYAAGETKDIRGIHKILFGCPPKGQGPPFMQLMYETENAQEVVGSTAVTKLRINELDVQLLRSEIAKGPFVDDAYISTFIVLTPRIIGLLQGATTLGISMVHKAGATYVGFDADFLEGKSKVLAYLRPCLSGLR